MINATLQREIQPWIEVFLLALEALRACRTWVASPRGLAAGQTSAEVCAKARTALETAPHRLFSDLLTSRLSEFAQT